MKYQVIALNTDGEYCGYEKDIFDTKAEAETFIATESTQMESNNVEEFIVVMLLDKDD